MLLHTSRCVVGYSGGHDPDPTYRRILDHTEALLVEFDSNVLSYEDLVVEWARRHTPIGQRKCQYRSAVWYLNEEQKEMLKQKIPLKRFGVAEDIANSTAFLASSEASYITGQTIHVNGGMLMV